MRTRNVAVVILYDNGRILLQKRSKTAKRFPDSWGLFGGGVEDGEMPIRALKREVFEELELEFSTEPRFFKSYKYKLPENGEQGTVHVFKSFYEGESLILREGQDMRWFRPEEVVKLSLYPIYREIIAEIVRDRVYVISCCHQWRGG